MKNKIYHLTGIVLLILFLSGCSDFLQVTDSGSVSSSVFPSTLDQVDLMLTASYAGIVAFALLARWIDGKIKSIAAAKSA